MTSSDWLLRKSLLRKSAENRQIAQLGNAFDALPRLLGKKAGDGEGRTARHFHRRLRAADLQALNGEAGRRDRAGGRQFADLGGDLEIDAALGEHIGREGDVHAECLPGDGDGVVIRRDRDREFATGQELRRLAGDGGKRGFCQCACEADALERLDDRRRGVAVPVGGRLEGGARLERGHGARSIEAGGCGDGRAHRKRVLDDLAEGHRAAFHQGLRQVDAETADRLALDLGDGDFQQDLLTLGNRQQVHDRRVLHALLGDFLGPRGIGGLRDVAADHDTFAGRRAADPAAGYQPPQHLAEFGQVALYRDIENEKLAAVAAENEDVGGADLLAIEHDAARGVDGRVDRIGVGDDDVGAVLRQLDHQRLAFAHRHLPRDGQHDIRRNPDDRARAADRVGLGPCGAWGCRDGCERDGDGAR